MASSTSHVTSSVTLLDYRTIINATLSRRLSRVFLSKIWTIVSSFCMVSSRVSCLDWRTYESSLIYCLNRDMWKMSCVRSMEADKMRQKATLPMRLIISNNHKSKYTLLQEDYKHRKPYITLYQNTLLNTTRNTQNC